MKIKKIVMIILLIAFVGAIGFVLINTNNKAIANNNQNTTTSVKTSNINEKVKNNKNEIDDKTVTISAADETNSVTISAENSNQTNSISDNTTTVNNTKSAVKNNHNAVTSNMVTTVKTSQTKNTETKSNIRKSKEKAIADTNNMVNITDNFFIEQTNDVYYNMQDYIGKTIKMEGLIYSYEDSNKDICYAVVRNTPGCCGNDGLAGIDIRYDEDYPEKNTWVEVIGVITTDTTFGNTIPVIQVSQMHEKEVGTTFVSN